MWTKSLLSFTTHSRKQAKPPKNTVNIWRNKNKYILFAFVIVILIGVSHYRFHFYHINCNLIIMITFRCLGVCYETNGDLYCSSCRIYKTNWIVNGVSRWSTVNILATVYSALWMLPSIGSPTRGVSALCAVQCETLKIKFGEVYLVRIVRCSFLFHWKSATPWYRSLCKNTKKINKLFHVNELNI